MKNIIVFLAVLLVVNAKCVNVWTGNNFDEQCDDGLATHCFVDDDNRIVDCTMNKDNAVTECHAIGIFGTNNHRGNKNDCCYDSDDCKKSCKNHICT